MSLAQPPGCRSTDIGGSWQNARGDNGTNYMLTEIEQLLAALPQNAIEQSMFRSEVKRFILRAERGDLDLRSPLSDGCVVVMRIVTDVLEIVAGPRRTAAGVTIHVRIYFSEPDTHPDLLLGLSIKGKSPGEVGLDGQDEHAREAQRRLDGWTVDEDYA